MHTSTLTLTPTLSPSLSPWGLNGTYAYGISIFSQTSLPSFSVARDMSEYPRRVCLGHRARAARAGRARARREAEAVFYIYRYDTGI